VTEFGGPEVLAVSDVPEPEPGPGEVLVQVSLAGLNFGDTHQREGQYVAEREVPFVLGGEVAGTADGARVVALLDTGGYAEYAVAPAERVFPIPDGPRTTAKAPLPRLACRHPQASCRSSPSRPIIGTAESNIEGTALNVTNSGTGPVPSDEVTANARTGSARPLTSAVPQSVTLTPSTARARWVTPSEANASPALASEHNRAARFNAPPR